MPELRKNPLTGQWVSVAPERSRRPSDYAFSHGEIDPAICPFCPGNEHATPPALLTYADDDGVWLLRAFPNRYPALRSDVAWDARAVGPYDRSSGVGAHEVIVHTPRHAARLGLYDDAQVARWFRAAAERSRDLAGDTRMKYVAHFQNHGSLAGASLAHPHSQLLALPVIPGAVCDELERAAAHYRLRGRDLVGDLVDFELDAGDRVIAEHGDAVSFCPWASAAPFEVWIVPRRHHSHMERDAQSQRDAVAALTADALRRLDAALADPPLNISIHGAPLQRADEPSYRWHVRISPALARTGGFERSTGCAVNTTAPERAAAYLREQPNGEEVSGGLGTTPAI